MNSMPQSNSNYTSKISCRLRTDVTPQMLRDSILRSARAGYETVNREIAAGHCYVDGVQVTSREQFDALELASRRLLV